MKEIVVKAENNSIKETECMFCGETSELSILSFISKHYNKDEYVIKYFCLCKKHVDAFNKIINGEINIDNLLEKIITNVPINFSLR